MTASPLEYLPAAEGFQDPDREGANDPGSAKAVVIPFGLEASVSYGTGTGRGPDAILAASQQLELFDDELRCEAYKSFGIATVRQPDIAPTLPAALEQLDELVEAVVGEGRFPLILGGEHALTAGAIRPFVRRYAEVVILQIDAHADLRDGYLGEHFSHASAMRRVLDYPQTRVVAVGIREISSPEVAFLQSNPDRVSVFWAKDQDQWCLEEIAHQVAGKPVYVTFDVDGLDAAVMPATGTPTPGGIQFRKSLDVLRAVARSGRIVGADVVELAPITGWHAYDMTAAAISNKLLNYALTSSA